MVLLALWLPLWLPPMWLLVVATTSVVSCEAACVSGREQIVVCVATTIAAMPRAAAMMTKEAINAAFETPLSQGIQFERRLFQSLFTTDDQKEGMKAYVEKRSAHFRDR